MSEEDRRSAVDVAARLLRHGDRSRAELERRLAERQIDPQTIGEALDTLERVGVLDDERTASFRAAKLAERGYGGLWIRAELERRGLPVEAALTGLEPEVDRAAKLVERKSVSAAWLARKGFDPEVVARVAGSGSRAVRYGA